MKMPWTESSSKHPFYTRYRRVIFVLFGKILPEHTDNYNNVELGRYYRFVRLFDDKYSPDTSADYKVTLIRPFVLETEIE